VDFVQEFGKPLDSVYDNNARSALNFLSDAPGKAAQSNKHGGVEHVIGWDISKILVNEIGLADLAWAKEEVGLSFQKRLKSGNPLD
jgi:hypothetical protein